MPIKYIPFIPEPVEGQTVLGSFNRILEYKGAISDSEIKIDKLGYVIRNGVKTKGLWNGTITSEKKPLRLKIRNICGDETVWEI